MAVSNGGRNSESFILSVKPINYSLTSGTDIPAPAEEEQTHYPITPPTPGGGPLSSHPTTPDNIPGAFPRSSSVKENAVETSMEHERADSFRTPNSPASAAHRSSSPSMQRKPSGVRRLLSLNNLRSSFSSSRTSLSMSRQLTTADETHTNGVKRPSSPSQYSSTSSSVPPKQRLRKTKSGSWFKRKSSMLFMNQDVAMDEVDEDRVTDTRDSKRLKENQPPLLPEINLLGDGSISGGDLGWDETAFSRV